MSADEILMKMVQHLKEEVDAELANDHPAHHHGRPIGYNNGCKGPLCRKSQRDRLRKRGAIPVDDFRDQYLEARLAEHKETLKGKKEKVA